MGIVIIGGSKMGETIAPVGGGAKMGRTQPVRVDDTTAVLLGMDAQTNGNITARVVKVLPDNSLVVGTPTTLKTGPINLDTSMTGGMMSATRCAAFWCESGSTIYGVPFTVSGLDIIDVGTILTGFSDENPTFQSDPVSGYGALTYVTTSGLNVSSYKIYNLVGNELNQTAFGTFDSGGGTTDFAIMESYDHPGAAATLVTYMESVSAGQKWWRGSYYEFGTGSLANRQDLQISTSFTAGVADFNMLQCSAPLTSTLALQLYKNAASTRSIARVTNYSTAPVLTGEASATMPSSTTRIQLVPLDATTAMMFKSQGSQSDSNIQLFTVDATAATPVVSSQIGSAISQDGSFNDEVRAVKMSDGNVLFTYPTSASETVVRMATAAGAVS